jgi:hypothetical protein
MLNKTVDDEPVCVNIYKVGFEVLTAVSMKIAVFNIYKVCLFYEGTLSVSTQGVPQVPT